MQLNLPLPLVPLANIIYTNTFGKSKSSSLKSKFIVNLKNYNKIQFVGFIKNLEINSVLACSKEKQLEKISWG